MRLFVINFAVTQQLYGILIFMDLFNFFNEWLIFEIFFLFCSFILKFVDLEQEQEPMNMKEVARRYKKEIEAVVSTKWLCAGHFT